MPTISRASPRGLSGNTHRHARRISSTGRILCRMSAHWSEQSPRAVPPRVGLAVYAAATGVTIALAVVSFLREPTSGGGIAFAVLACAGLVAVRLVWHHHIAVLLDPVTLWALAGLASGWGWGPVLTGGIQDSWMSIGGFLLGAALIGALRVYTSRYLYSPTPDATSD